MAIEIVDFPIEKWADVPLQNVSSPEGIPKSSRSSTDHIYPSSFWPGVCPSLRHVDLFDHLMLKHRACAISVRLRKVLAYQHGCNTKSVSSRSNLRNESIKILQFLNDFIIIPWQFPRTNILPPHSMTFQSPFRLGVAYQNRMIFETVGGLRYVSTSGPRTNHDELVVSPIKMNTD